MRELHTGSRALHLINEDLKRPDIPIILPKPYGERKDHGDLSDAFKGMRDEPNFQEPSVIPLANGDNVVFLSLPAAAPHTNIKLRATMHGSQIRVVTNSSVEGPSMQIPAQQFHWLYRQRADGTASPISYADLATFPLHEKQAILTEYAQRLITGKKTLDEALLAQRIPGGERGTFIYATVGHHPSDLRVRDGLGRGSQSNPTIHGSVTFFPPHEHLTKRKPIRETSPAALLKDIDPLSSIFFDVTKRPFQSLLEGIILDNSLSASVEIIPESSHHSEPFPFGWKVNFPENVGLDTGIDIFLHFISQMKLLWEEGKALRKDLSNPELQTRIASVIGSDGVDVLGKLMPAKGERTDEETTKLRKKVTSLRERISAVKTADGQPYARKIYMHLFEDLLSDTPRFTMPGDPSFNILFEVDTTNNHLKSLYITPAMSDKGIAERITGAVLERAERH